MNTKLEQLLIETTLIAILVLTPVAAIAYVGLFFMLPDGWALISMPLAYVAAGSLKKKYSDLELRLQLLK